VGAGRAPSSRRACSALKNTASVVGTAALSAHPLPGVDREPVEGERDALLVTELGREAVVTWQTERLLALEVARDDWTVHVRPELVVEIAFDGVQTSTRYPGGVALRFARVLRHRPDKSAAEADTLDAVLAVHAAGG
jgi:hypothetical protein